MTLSSRTGDVDGAALEAALRRFAGALLGTPQFTLAGLTPPPWDAPPRLVLPEFEARALCERHAPAIVGALATLEWRCDADGVSVTRAASR